MMELLAFAQLTKDVWAVNEIDRTVMYIINGAEKALLIDTGFGLTDLKDSIRRICGEKPVIVVNTHAHVDHMTGNCQFKRIYVGRFDEIYARADLTQQMKKICMDMYFEEIIQKGFDITGWHGGPSKEIYTVKEGDCFDLGSYQFEVIEVPSHTFGSICLWEKRQGWMFTGDMILEWPVWGHLTHSPLAPSASLINYFYSIEKIRSRKEQITYIFPSHVPADKKEDKNKYFMPVSVLDIYSEGIRSVLSGTAEVREYSHMLENAKIAEFAVGGITFQDARMK